ncbi:phosphogluconate dehydratase [Crenobacter cavernae]|uniref:Phosphogluconate dehydratase n=1 Tax=Crenobacter cavernae TaxID=2290923 RepID=A0A345Y4E7_9NEIS|nr:phosphogluconate dehydratase [Crenobacter cavernae]AXK38799.1 phosphogluconate dehydratase [Crenobacter cavernae]
MPLDPRLADITERLVERSRATRKAYLNRLAEARAAGRVARGELSCTNQAHGYAGMPDDSKFKLKVLEAPNLAIVSSYNDVLSAHQPLDDYPDWIKEAAREAGATAQFAGGVPAMCDGVTQGQNGMELSLFSRDVIAMATAVALSHRLFDGVLYLGVCDKIVPGLLLGALSFGHLPGVFVPGGPMPTGMANADKALVRERYAKGEIGPDALLDSEMRSYHAPGTCTFYGTANSNQMLLEAMGLMLPGAAFVPPGTPLREALTRESARTAARLAGSAVGLGEMVDEKAIVNAVVALLATGGSTNHTLHWVAIARAAGIQLTWDDYAELSAITPLVTRVYPNGDADINAFHDAGGTGWLIRDLLDAGLLHPDVATVAGSGLAAYTRAPRLKDGQLEWHAAPQQSGDTSVLRSAADPFDQEGGLRLVAGNVGRAIVKTSAVAPDKRAVTAPALVFSSQEAMLAAFRAGQLERDFIAVLPFQGPRANGMPELHALTPALSVLQKAGHQVALVTDGRMSGASGKVPAAIHVCPEAQAGGGIAKIRDGDLIRLDPDKGVLEVLVDAADWAARPPGSANLASHHYGVGRELFAGFRQLASAAEDGATSFGGAF